MSVTIQRRDPEETALINRAIRALRRTEGLEASATKSEVITIDGRHFVACVSPQDEIQAVYRVRTNGLLRRVR